MARQGSFASSAFLTLGLVALVVGAILLARVFGAYRTTDVVGQSVVGSLFFLAGFVLAWFGLRLRPARERRDFAPR